MSHKTENIFIDAIEQNEQKLIRVCSVYAKDDEDSKDLFQEVLIQIWSSMSSFKGNSSLNTWIFRIALNVCLRFNSKQVRWKTQFVSLDEQMLQNIRQESQRSEDNQKLDALRRCIKLLNEADKAIMTLYLEDLAYKDIATITGLKGNTIAVRVKRIKNKLLNCINEKL